MGRRPIGCNNLTDITDVCRIFYYYGSSDSFPAIYMDLTIPVALNAMYVGASQNQHD